MKIKEIGQRGGHVPNNPGSANVKDDDVQRLRWISWPEVVGGEGASSTLDQKIFDFMEFFGKLTKCKAGSLHRPSPLLYEKY